MKRISLALIFLFIYSASAVSIRRPPQPVKLKFLPAETAPVGSAIEAKLEIEIDDGWHIFSEKPEIEGIKATQVSLDPSDAYSVLKITFPKPVAVRSPIFQKDLNFYQNKVTISMLLKAEVAGEIPVKGTLAFQACSDKLCLPPAKQVFSGIQVIR